MRFRIKTFMTKQPNKKDQSSSSIMEHYRNHTLCFVDSDSMCIGEVFKNDERLAYCESLDIDSARQYCRQIIDVRLNKQSIDNLNIKPEPHDFIKAMLSINAQIGEHCQHLLLTHLENNNQPISIDTLKTHGGFSSTTAVFLQYAEWARLICDALAYLPPSQPSGKDPFLSLVIHYEEPNIEDTCGLAISLTPDIFNALAHISKL